MLNGEKAINYVIYRIFFLKIFIEFLYKKLELLSFYWGIYYGIEKREGNL